MSKKNFEQQLAVLEELRLSPGSPSTAGDLRKALLNRNNYIVAKAAQVAGELALREIVPDLLLALDRFFIDPAKSDPQCWAKNALTKALADLGHNDSAAFLRGLRHLQLEPVWGGREDTAATLRGQCALALVQCRDLSDFEVLSHLIEVLVDHDKTVRMEAARAVGRLGRPEAALLLRLRALVGDQEPEVLGACFSALLSIEGREGLGFIGRFLDAGGDAAAEAGLAAGLMRGPDAFHFLKQRWERERDASLAGVLLTAIALTRETEALDFLLGLIQTDSVSAASAISALASGRLSPDLRARVAEAVEQSGNARLRPAFEKHFG